MASIEMVSSIGVIFSPKIMGSILTSCVYLPTYRFQWDYYWHFAPQTVFYVDAVRDFYTYINVSES